MKRRQFIFRSLKSSVLLSPILSLRLAKAADVPKRLFCFLDAGTPYVDESDFFPSQTGQITALAHNLSGFKGLEQDMVIVNGMDYNQDQNQPGNWHVASVGQCFTASRPIMNGDNGTHTGPSIDTIVASALGVKSHVCNVSNKDRAHMRNRPFAVKTVSNGQSRVDYNRPIIAPLDAWKNIFGEVSSGGGSNAGNITSSLMAKKSILDATLDDLKRFRGQLNGTEREKMDIHLDAIETAELGIQRDLASNQNSQSCSQTSSPSLPSDKIAGPVDVGLVAQRANVHFDILFAGFACQLIGVGGLMLGYSGEDDEYNYNWVPGITYKGDFHGDIWHQGRNQHALNRLAAQWQWGQLGKFCQRLKATPEGNGTMLDNVLSYGTSIFGTHHHTTRVPVVYVGNAQGQLKTGNYIRLTNTKQHCQALTSVAHLMGVPIKGLGDDPNCGPLAELKIAT